MGIINDPYLAFCFDEACDFIDNQRYYEEQKDGTLVEKWNKKPNWIDEKGNNSKRPINNSALIEQMKKQSEKFKK